MDLPQNELWKHGAGEAAADRSQGSHSERFRMENELMEIFVSIIGFLSLQPMTSSVICRSEIQLTINWIRTHLEEDPQISLPKHEVSCGQCTVYCLLSTVYCVPCTVYRVPCTVYRVPCTVYCTVQYNVPAHYICPMWKRTLAWQGRCWRLLVTVDQSYTYTHSLS